MKRYNGWELTEDKQGQLVKWDDVEKVLGADVSTLVQKNNNLINMLREYRENHMNSYFRLCRRQLIGSGENAPVYDDRCEDCKKVDEFLELL